MKKYTKKALNVKEQEDLLRERGLIIADSQKLQNILANISYYHLSIYFKHFQHDDDSFIENVTFEDVWNVYVFDQKLRLLLLDLLERIEKSFKSRVVREVSLACDNPCWLEQTSLFKDQQNYQEKTIPILQNLKNSKELYLQSYFQNYSEPAIPPAWIVFESLTFGQSVMIFRQLDNSYQKIIAKTYNVSFKTVGPWMYALSIVRNICAHHSQLWNREIVVGLSTGVGVFEGCFSEDRPKRLFNYLVVIQIFLSNFNATSDWVARLEELVDEYDVEISHMGFPRDWALRLQKSRKVVVLQADKTKT